MRRLLILTALEYEARELARRLGLAAVAGTGGTRYVGGGVCVTVVGPRGALLSSRAPIVGDPPALVVSAGVCGGLAPELPAAAVVVPRTVVDGRGRLLPVDGAAHARALGAASRAGIEAAAGLLVAIDEVLDSPGAKAAWWRRTGAVAVDTESAVILAAAARAGVPALVLRAVADTASRRLPRDVVGLVDAAGRLSRGRAVLLALGRPTLVAEALALRRATRRALAAVAAVLRGLATEPEADAVPAIAGRETSV